jgi:flagellar basal body rod protein FlgB
MDTLLSIPDNVSEVLVKIIRFTELRRRLLHQNIHHVDDPGYTPRDLPVREFAEVLSEAVAEHLRSHRLLFRDTAGVKFGPNNMMQIQPVVDSHARGLLRTDRDEYMELQINKLLENSLNRQIAQELLRHQCGVCPPLPAWDVNTTGASDPSSRNSAPQRDATE